MAMSAQALTGLGGGLPHGGHGRPVQGLVGPTKEGDVPAVVRMEAYEAVLGYFPAGRVLLASLGPEELGIVPLRFDNAFWCRRCLAMATAKTCPHPDGEHVALSGTQVRAMLAAGQLPPPEFSRAEVAAVLIAAARP